MSLDRRLNAFRPDLADARLRGKVEAARFVDGDIHEVVHAQAPLRREPRHDAALDTEALYGERVRVYEIDEEGWHENQGALEASYGNCQGWSQMLCAMKAWIEHGINLREGMYK